MADNEEKPKKKGSMKVLLLIVMPLVLIAAAGAGLYFTGLLDGMLGMEESAEQEITEPEPLLNPFFMNLPSMIVNIDTGEDRIRFLRVEASLKLENEADKTKVLSQMPRVLDSVQTVLHKRKAEEVQGPENMRKIQDQIWKRIDRTLDDVKVHGVIINNFSIN